MFPHVKQAKMSAQKQKRAFLKVDKKTLMNNKHSKLYVKFIYILQSKWRTLDRIGHYITNIYRCYLSLSSQTERLKDPFALT